MSAAPNPRLETTYERLRRHPGRVVAVTLAVIALLAVPFLTMAPDQSASTEPTGDVFTARDLVDDNFASTVRGIGFVVEHESGDLLRVEPLTELLQAAETLRDDAEVGPTMLTYYEADLDREVTGIVTIAEIVDEELRADGGAGLSEATDAEVKAAGADLIERLGERSDLLGISSQSFRDESGDWIVPAINTFVLADDTVLGFGAQAINLGGDTEPEEYDRSVQELLRTADSFQVNGIAIDVNLTSQEQGAVAGPFIGFTILAVLILVGATFRSYWVLAVVSSAFLALIVWLKGISNLIGLEDDLVLSLIVPVAMISFGVDFAFHAIGRYREERAEGQVSSRAFVVGLGAVTAALVLALVSDSAAFLANLTSGIESINQFGIGAAIALAGAFALLGVISPLLVAHIEGSVPPPASGRRATALRIAGAVGAASMTMASVLLMVFVLPWLGLILAALTVVVTLVVPYVVRSRRLEGAAVGEQQVDVTESRAAVVIGRVVSTVAARPAIVLGSALAISAVAATFAVRVPAEFDVEDFFSSDTDFVVGLDQIDTHVGDRGGEPALLYVEGDLTDPGALTAIDARIDELRALDTPSLARDDAGLVEVEGSVFEVLDATWESPVMASIVAERTGVELTDVDGDGIPDERAQVEALLGVAAEIGVPLDGERNLLTPDDVGTVVSFDGDTPATVLELQLVDSRSQESVSAASDDLEAIAAGLSADLGDSFVQVTGSPFVRESSLDATNRALQVSLPVALMLCLLVSTVFLRSIRYGVASIVPIMMVVAWLYAVMELAGFAINIVTATIAAVSIGIGIDFAIHFIARYREELARTGTRDEATRIAGEGTGLALVASAISSAIGFGILAFAPMPLFASYGLLTAVMILMALVATLLVLPSVLRLITTDSVPGDAADVNDSDDRLLATV
ncbi:MAG: efflux RND transporter permease subunit [Actinomycetota bacterium]